MPPGHRPLKLGTPTHEYQSARCVVLPMTGAPPAPYQRITTTTRYWYAALPANARVMGLKFAIWASVAVRFWTALVTTFVHPVDPGVCLWIRKNHDTHWVSTRVDVFLAKASGSRTRIELMTFALLYVHRTPAYSALSAR